CQRGNRRRHRNGNKQPGPGRRAGMNHGERNLQRERRWPVLYPNGCWGLGIGCWVFVLVLVLVLVLGRNRPRTRPRQFKLHLASPIEKQPGQSPGLSISKSENGYASAGSASGGTSTSTSAGGWKKSASTIAPPMASTVGSKNIEW